MQTVGEQSILTSSEGHRSLQTPCATELCAQTVMACDAVRLTQLGARAGLVCRLTGLEKAVARRLYRQLHGRPSPPGQLPFTDTWYLKHERRMLHASIVWQLSQRLAGTRLSPARLLIAVYESYLFLVDEPLLDIAHAAFVPQLVEMWIWQERTCQRCRVHYLMPVGSPEQTCQACRLYHRYRCRRCGAPLTAPPRGRRRTLCDGCQGMQRDTRVASARPLSHSVSSQCP